MGVRESGSMQMDTSQVGMRGGAGWQGQCDPCIDAGAEERKLVQSGGRFVTSEASPTESQPSDDDIPVQCHRLVNLVCP
ncbi:hypothetical protein BH20ACT5_BH20ACT5_13700 [soil metagenome]